jgi:PhoPQ-activated pathogenicity-related protein
LVPEVKFVPLTIQTALAAGEAMALNANALATVTIKSLTLGIAM